MVDSFYETEHGLRMPERGNCLDCTVEKQVPFPNFRHFRSIFCLPLMSTFSDFFDLCLHWLSIVRETEHEIWPAYSLHFDLSRPVVPGCAGCAMAYPDFGRSINPISTHLITTGTLGFSDLPTALLSM